MREYLPCLYAFLGCVGFCVIFEVKRPLFVFLAAAIGAVFWTVYLLMDGYGSEVGRYLVATVVVSILSEICARILKAPVTIFLIIGIIPLVPGGGLYYTMDHLINGDIAAFVQQGLRTAAYAGAIAVGVSLVSSLARILFWRRRPRKGEACARQMSRERREGSS